MKYRRVSDEKGGIEKMRVSVSEFAASIAERERINSPWNKALISYSFELPFTQLSAVLPYSFFQVYVNVWNRQKKLYNPSITMPTRKH
jgi:hypothetical protein